MYRYLAFMPYKTVHVRHSTSCRNDSKQTEYRRKAVFFVVLVIAILLTSSVAASSVLLIRPGTESSNPIQQNAQSTISGSVSSSVVSTNQRSLTQMNSLPELLSDTGNLIHSIQSGSAITGGGLGSGVQVSFTVSNLAAGTAWTLWIYNYTGSSIPEFNLLYHSPLGREYANTSTSTSMIAYLPQGEYTLYAGPGSDSSFIAQETFNVTSSGSTVNVVLPKYYSVTVQESGLPAGMLWNALAFNQTTVSTPSLLDLVNGSSSALTLYLPNGTYILFAGPYSSYLQQNNFTVAGSSATVNLNMPTFYQVIFDEKNLPTNSQWLMQAVNSSTTMVYVNFSSSTSMSGFFPIGTYNATAAAMTGASVSKEFTVSGPQTLTITFPSLYKVTFNEKNVPPGATWSVDAYNSTNNVYYYNSSSSSSMTAFLQNGTYIYYYYLGGVTEGSSEFTINGADLTIPITYPVTYKVTFTQTNLPTGMSWSMSASNGNYSFQYYNSSTGSTMVGYFPNGIYTYQASISSNSVVGTSGSFTVDGASTAVTVIFPSVYQVTFTENGLPSGTTWRLEVQNTSTFTISTNLTNSASTVFYLSDGSFEYYYGLASSGGFTTLGSGIVTVNGAPTTVSITFPALYQVTFQESGLHVGTYWYLSIDNQLQSITYDNSTNGTSMVAWLPDGTYNYSAGIGSTGTPDKEFTVSGAPLIINVKFSSEYQVTFTESNLLIGTSWSLSVSNYNSSINYYNASSGNSMVDYLPNGTYNYTATEVNNAFTLFVSVTHEFVVSGSKLAISFSFPSLYEVNFTATNLPSGISWTLECYNASNTVSYSNTTTGNSMLAYFPDGTYSYDGYANVQGEVQTASYTLTVNGAPERVDVPFPTIYYLNFTESGLAAGTSWSVTANGYILGSSIGKNISFAETNGSFSYEVSSVSGYEVSPTYGTANIQGSNVTVAITFSPISYVVTFQETGLASGSWYVNISETLTNGSIFQVASGPLSSSTYSTALPNGSYTYAISTNNKDYAPSTYTGALSVFGSAVNTIVQFSPVTFGVTFLEAGLPSSVIWYVNVTNSTGVTTSYSGSGTITFSLMNGSYTYTIQSSNRDYEPSSYSGTLSVAGSAISRSVTFSAVTFGVTFMETGLPTTVTWYVNVTDASGAVTHHSGTGTISFALMNGSYSFTVESADKNYGSFPASGTFSISGAGVTKQIKFGETYTLTFKEYGLPSGITWYLNLTNSSNFRTSYSGYGTITVQLLNGTYKYTAQTADKLYSPENSSGTITVDGSAVNDAVIFSLVTYNVTFKESGLPAGTDWYLNVSGGSMLESSTSTIVDSLPNGTYTFEISNTSTYYTSVTGGTISVNGKNITEAITFQHFAYITGTLAPGNASLVINGKTISPSSGSFNVSVPAGSYEVVASENGYQTFYSNFTISADQVKTLAINLTKTPSKQPLISGNVLYYIAGGVGAVVIVGIVLALVIRRRK